MIFTSTSYTAFFSFHGNQTNKPLYSYKKSRKSPPNLQSLHTVTLTLALKSPKQGKKKEKKRKSLSNLQGFNTIALTLILKSPKQDQKNGSKNKTNLGENIF